MGVRSVGDDLTPRVNRFAPGAMPLGQLEPRHAVRTPPAHKDPRLPNWPWPSPSTEPHSGPLVEYRFG